MEGGRQAGWSRGQAVTWEAGVTRQDDLQPAEDAGLGKRLAAGLLTDCSHGAGPLQGEAGRGNSNEPGLPQL